MKNEFSLRVIVMSGVVENWSLYLEGEREEPYHNLEPWEYQRFCLMCLDLELRLELASVQFLPPEREEEVSSDKPKPR